MIAIHNNKSDVLFHYRWIQYCEENNIPYKLVDCFANDIIEQIKGCKVLMWHFHQSNPISNVMAKSLLFAVEQSGIQVFPDFNTAWHFDDKIGQKYLMEGLKIPMVPTWIFYRKNEALSWVEQTQFPKVLKLRGGAGSQNVQLVVTKKKAKKIIRRAFSKGLPNYDRWGSLKERYRKWRMGIYPFLEIIKGIIRLIYPPRYNKVQGREIDYVYFQQFIRDNDSDTRIIVINGKAFALKRWVRDQDFRASGSGKFSYSREDFDERCVSLAFEYTEKMKAQCVAFDFVFDQKNNPLLLEVSYGFANRVYDPCEGYWDQNLKWHEGEFNPYGWMIEYFVK